MLAARDSEEEIIPSRWINLSSTIFLHPEYLEHGSEQIISWYQTNKDFQIDGYRMEELVEAHHIAGNTLGHTEFTLVQKILRTLRKRCEERELLTTREALGPRSTQPRDIIAILLSCQVPVVFRQHADH